MVSKVTGHTQTRRAVNIDASAMLRIKQKQQEKAHATGTTKGWTTSDSKKAIDFSKFNPSYEIGRSGRSPASPVTSITMKSGKTVVQWDAKHGFTAGANRRPLTKTELRGLEKALEQHPSSGVMRPSAVVLSKVQAALK